MKRTINIYPTWRGIAQIIFRSGNFGHQTPFIKKMLFQMATAASVTCKDNKFEQEEVSLCLFYAFKETAEEN
jgi:hypothetical protein